ncbi:MAG: metallophosphatase, partial [Bacteroidales bacterium]|nr:metallophosphatase [Bacteroidales bacterium]
GIYMCYGRYTGGNTVYNHLPNGARIILLKEDRPGFETWITLKGGQRINRMTLQ